MIINNVELPDIDVADAIQMEKYENALENTATKLKTIDNSGKASVTIRQTCKVVFEFFNELFGEGTDKKVFGNSVNMNTAINAYEEVVNAVKKADKDLAESYKARTFNKNKNTNPKYYNKKRKRR